METKYNIFVDEKYGIIQKIVPFVKYPGDDIYVCAAVGNLSSGLERIGYGKNNKLAADTAAENYLAMYLKNQLGDISKISEDKIWSCAFGDNSDYVIYQAKKRCVEMLSNSNVKNKNIYIYQEAEEGEIWSVGLKLIELDHVKKLIVNASNTEELCRNELKEKYNTIQNIYHNLKRIEGIPLINYDERIQEGFYCVKINFISHVLEVIYDKKYYFCMAYLEDKKYE